MLELMGMKIYTNDVYRNLCSSHVPHITMGWSVIVAIPGHTDFSIQDIAACTFPLIQEVRILSSLNLLSGVVVQASYYKSKDMNYCLQ